MYEEIIQAVTDSPEARDILEELHRQNMQEIRAAVTRGASGIEASYFCDQVELYGLSSSSS